MLILALNRGAGLWAFGAVVVLLIVWWYLKHRATPTTTTVPVLTLGDITPLGVLRVTVDLGSGGTGNLTRTGNGCFWIKPNGKIAMFQQGQHAPEWFPSGWPIIEWEIDPAVLPGKDMNTAPRMKYVRTVGDFYDGHIIAASGGQVNWMPGGFAPVEDLGGGILRFRWTYSDGYAGYPGYPQYCMTDLNYETGAYQSYGPWKIAVDGHRHISSQIIKLPEWFRDAHCPGYSYAAIGQMGSGNLGSPAGSSLIAIEDFDPRTKPVATNATDPATVKSIYLIHHGPDHKMRRPANFAICTWGDNAHPYDCRVASAIIPAQPLFGGTGNNESMGIEDNDTQVGVQWVDLPDRQGLMFFYRLTSTPKGYTAPGDPHGFVHVGYANALHGDQSGSGFANQGCCHAVAGLGQYDPDWTSTGPFSNFHMPAVSIYDPAQLIAVRAGSKKLWECLPQPGAELADWGDVDPLYKIHPPKSPTDHYGVVFLTGTSWVDPRDRRLYLMSHYDFVTTPGQRLPHVSVYQIASGEPTEPPIDPPVDPPVVEAPSVLAIASGKGSPEGRVAAPVGAIYTNSEGTPTLYVKESNPGGTSGWVAK